MRMLYKIMTYNLFNIPGDLYDKFRLLCKKLTRKESGWEKVAIIFFSIIYFFVLTFILMAIIAGATYKWKLVLTIYVMSCVLNIYSTSFGKQFLFLSKNPTAVLEQIKFVLLGPFTQIKMLYLFICLRMYLSSGQYWTFVYTKGNVGRIPNRDKIFFLYSLQKYQQRLKDYS